MSSAITTTQNVDHSEDYFNDLIPDVSDLFPLKKNLLCHVKFQKAVQKIVSYIRQIPDVQKLRINFDLVKRSANLIENFLFKSKSVDKKALLISAFKTVFNLNPAEIIIISDFIDFLHSNGYIKKLSFTYKNYRKLKNFAGKQLKL
jgi:hypothetical protein